MILSLVSCNPGSRDKHDVVYTRCDKSGDPDANGDYILFGEYPQSLKSVDVDITSTVDERNYYLGSDGAYYAMVIAAPYADDYNFSDGTAVTEGEAYYFKVEPIRWRILSTDGESAMLLCDSIITNLAYQSDASKNNGTYYTSANGAPYGTYANNYKYSEARAWLNGSFCDAAFSEHQRDNILKTVIDNVTENVGAVSDGYATENTEDNVFLLSYGEACDAKLGFSGDPSEYDIKRRIITSDYARANGALMKTSEEFYGNGSWWLRSPSDSSSVAAWRIDTAGATDDGYVNRSYFGIVPVVRIKL